MLKILKVCNLHIIKRCYAKKPKTEDMKYLNVAEKNDAAKTIAGQLSNGTARRREGYSVYNKIYEFEAVVRGTKSKMVMTSVSGHLLHLEFLSSYRNWNNVDPQSLFEAPVRKACSDDFIKIKQTLEREVRGCQGLIIWTDCDREGENIGFEIVDVCRAIKPNITVYRAIFSEITGAGVKRALQNLTAPDKRQSDAVDVRTELDLRTGAAITRFQTMRLQRLFPEKISDKLISYGSCQIPTLGFVAERYKEIEAFVSEPFWKIKVTHTIDDLTVEFLWARNRLFDKQACEDYYLLVVSNPKATVESVTVKPKSKWRPTPMDTVELEKIGSRKLKLSAKEVMTIAEKLYTKGIISYPRTETNMFSKEIDLKGLVEQQTSHNVWGSFAQRVAQWGPNPRNGTKSDQAHPPIHPTKMVPHMDGNEGRVYELICRHFLACVSKDATGSETVVKISIEGEKFTATGLVIYERNYLDVYVYEKWNAKQIHKYEEGQVFEPTEITMPEGATTAPPLLTEADLIALMEKHGIGTDATHAEHINTIKERGYIGVVDNGCLVPGVIGMGLYEGYDAMELALAKPMLRAEFEQDLKKICLGEKDPKVVLREQIIKYKESYKQIMDKITAMDEKMSQRILETPRQRNNSNGGTNGGGGSFENNNLTIQELFKCPKCSVAPLALKPKKNQSGFFIGCLNYPDCKNVVWLPDECKDPKVLDETCNKCGADVKLLKFKFSTAYHKTLFNADTGWYKCCLRCDSKFRNTFNINLESVKRVGPIVADSTTIPINYGTALPTAAGSNSSNLPGGSRPKKDSTKTKKPKDTDTETKAKKPRKNAATTSTASTSNIRSYFTSAQQTAEEIAAAELANVPMDAFFDSNDGFDDLILAAEANIPSTSSVRATTTMTTSRENPTRSTTSQSHHEAVLSDELAAEFNDDNDDVFADFQWGSGNTQTTQQRHIAPTTSNSASSSNTNGGAIPLDDSFAALLRDEDDFNEDYVWGSAAKNAKVSQQTTSNSGPAAKKPKLQTLETRYQEVDEEENDYAWGSNSRIHTEPEVNVNCSGCHQPGKQLSVKKDGPNKGRIFFVCPKPNQCKFFQWADEIEQDQHSNQPTRSSSSNNTSNLGWGARDVEGPDEREQVNCNCNIPANRLTVRKDGPNKDRLFYACSDRDKSCGFFKWADEDQDDFQQPSTSSRATSGHNTSNAGWGSRDMDMPDDREQVKCNCNKPANSLTVRKDGPNQGRGFYACSDRNKSCGFFKWADESEENSSNTQRSWGGSNNSNFTATQNKRASTSSAGASKGRKCGLCRQEGHSRVKCPRKAEFDF